MLRLSGLHVGAPALGARPAVPSAALVPPPAPPPPLSPLSLLDMMLLLIVFLCGW